MTAQPRAFAEELEAARSGDEDSFRILVEPHLSVVLAVAHGVLSSLPDAEDAVQEALIRLYRKVPPVASPAELRAYFCRLAGNEARRIAVARWFRLRRRSDSIDDVEGGLELPAPDDPERAAHFSAIHGAVLSLVDRLTARERQAFLLRAGEDLSHEEVAAILGVEIVTARRLYSLARQRLVRLLLDEKGIRVEFPD